MENKNYEEFDALIEERDFRKLKGILDELNEADVAAYLEQLPERQAVMIFRMLSKEIAADVFSHLSNDTQELIVEAITDNELKNILDDLFVDDTVDFLEELPANVVKRVLKFVPPERRKLLNQFLQYPEDSAGSIMTAEFVDLKKSMTVEQAFSHIRRTAVDRETIYTCYVTDQNRILEGVVSVRTLLLANDKDLIAEVMDTDVISLNTATNIEEVEQVFVKYDLLCAPVSDHENRLVGIITVDDVMDVMREETQKNFEIMGAMHPSERPYLKTGVFSLAKNRIVWLLVLMVSAMITGGILGKFEHAFAAMPLLVTFIPMLTDTGGNAGSQSSTLIIRGMAVGEISSSDFLRVFWKELRVSLVVGVVLSVVNYIRLILTYPGHEGIALTVALSLMATVVIAKTIGGLLPILAKKLRADPAIMAAPLITTVVDALSLILYFLIAQRLLGL